MYCPKCGTQLGEDASVCPNCGPVNEAVKIEYKPKKKYFRMPGKIARGYAAIFSAGLVLPAMLCIALDLTGVVNAHIAHNIYTCFCDTFIAAFAMVWMVLVFPVLRITRPSVSVTVALASITAFVFYRLYETGHQDWITRVALPVAIIVLALLSLDIVLIGNKKVKGFHAISMIALEVGGVLVAYESLNDKLNGGVQLTWSIVIACVFVSVIAFAEAFSYVGRLYRKKK